MQKTDLANFSSFLVRSGLKKGMDVITRGQSCAIFHIKSFLGCSLVFKGCRSGMCWCHWIKERTSLVGCKCVYCVKLCSLSTTVYNCVHCEQLYASVQFCTIRVLFLVLLLWSYSRKKLFFSLISFTLCHVQLSKSSKMLHVNNRQSEPNANNVLGVYECFWIVKNVIWKNKR